MSHSGKVEREMSEHCSLLGKSSSSSENGKCKCPGAERCLEIQRNGEEAAGLQQSK